MSAIWLVPCWIGAKGVSAAGFTNTGSLGSRRLSLTLRKPHHEPFSATASTDFLSSREPEPRRHRPTQDRGRRRRHAATSVFPGIEASLADVRYFLHRTRRSYGSAYAADCGGCIGASARRRDG